MNYDLTPDDDAVRLQSALLREPEGRAHPAEVVMYVVILPIVVAIVVAIAAGLL